MVRILIAAVLLTLAYSAPAKPKLLEHIPLVWRPTSDLRLGTTQMTAATVTIGQFTDARGNPQLIGENREDEMPKPVTTPDDVGAFVTKHLRELFSQAGVKTLDAKGSVTIQGEVTKFFVREEATYKSEVELHLSVVDSNGKTLWKGLASGDATRFGRSYRAENYYEVLSDALVNTVSSLLQSPEFQRALSGQAPEGS